MATRTWNGGSATTDNWTDADNWGGTAPVAGDSLVFDGSTRLSPVNDFASGTSFASITIAATAGNFNITGNAITLSGGAAAVACSKTSGSATIALNITISTAAPTINCAIGSTLTLSGTFSGSTYQVTYTGGGYITMSGNISGSGLHTVNIGAGYEMAYTGASNSFTGAVTITSGRLKITNSNGLGTGTKNISVNGSGGAPCIRLDGSGGNIVLGSNLSFLTSCVTTPYGAIYSEAGDNVINGTFSLTTGNGGTYIYVVGGTLTLNGNMSAASTTRTIYFRGTATGYFNGVLSSTNNPSISKEDSGTWYIRGASTITSSSTTTINNGTVYANGRAFGFSAVTVNSPGILRVDGTSGEGGRGLLARFYNVSTSPSPFATFENYTNAMNYWKGKSFNLVAAIPALDFGTGGTLAPAPYTSGSTNFQCWIKATLVVPTTGVYTFNTNSDDGSLLFIGTTLVVNNNGSHGMTTRTGTITLTAGVVYELNVFFYQGIGGWGLQSAISGADNTTMTNLSGTSTLFTLRTLDLQIASLAGNGSVVVTSGNTLVIGDNANASTTFSGDISGAGNVETVGTGTLTITGTNTYTGSTTINKGTLSIGNGTTNGSIANTSIIYDYNALIYNITSDQTQATPIAGTGTLQKLGSGTLNIPGAPLRLPENNVNGTIATSALSGNVTVSAGTLQAGGCALGTGLVTVESGAFLETTPTYGIGALHTRSNSSQTGLASDVKFFTWMAGTAIDKRGAVVTTLNMNSEGTTFPYPYNRSFWGDQINSGLFACRVVVGNTGTYTFRVGSDDGTMVWVNNTLVVNNNYSQSFQYRTGTIALTAGTLYDLVHGFNNSWGRYGFISTVSGANNTTYADIDTANANLTLYPDLFIGALAGDGEVKLTNGNLWVGFNTYNTGGTNTVKADTTFSGVISGTAGLRKWGAGSLYLTGTCTYTGTTEVWGGALIVNGSLAAGSAVSARGFGTLSGNGTINGAVSTADNGIIAPGAVLTKNGVVGRGTLTAAAGVTFGSTGRYLIDLAPVELSDVLAVTGTLTVGGELRLSSIGASDVGDVYTIATATVAVSGTFAGLVDGATFTTPTRLFTINYTTTTVILTDAGPNVNRPDLMNPFFGAS